jgi:hypothetical protein
MTALLRLAYGYASARVRSGDRAIVIVKGLIAQHGASRSYPSYRTAIKCCGISTSAAASCDLRTHELLLESWLAKASIVIEGAANAA